ncbi:hypothetical protein [Ensifer aridi]|uniref:hypothetical protein n=1 Tax=Ensifer aridi TaxID=1708715 RepID=UPI00111BF9B3|nr:hypothetical protein [Ensifer aridi]
MAGIELSYCFRKFFSFGTVRASKSANSQALEQERSNRPNQEAPSWREHDMKRTAEMIHAAPGQHQRSNHGILWRIVMRSFRMAQMHAAADFVEE